MKLVRLTVDEWAVTFGTARRRLGGAAARPGSSSLYQMWQPTHQRPDPSLVGGTMTRCQGPRASKALRAPIADCCKRRNHEVKTLETITLTVSIWQSECLTAVYILDYLLSLGTGFVIRWCHESMTWSHSGIDDYNDSPGPKTSRW